MDEPCSVCPTQLCPDHQDRMCFRCAETIPAGRGHYIVRTSDGDKPKCFNCEVWSRAVRVDDIADWYRQLDVENFCSDSRVKAP